MRIHFRKNCWAALIFGRECVRAWPSICVWLLVDNSGYDSSGNGNQTLMGGSSGYVYSYDAEGRIINVNTGGTPSISSTGYVP